MHQVSEPWFTWEMNVLSRMEHALNIPQCKGIRSIDRKRRIDPGIVYTGLCQNLLRANVKLSSIVCLINFFFFFSSLSTYPLPKPIVIHGFDRDSFKLDSNDICFFLFFFSCFVLYYSMIYICIVWYFSFFSRFVWSSNACWYGRATGISIFKRRNTMENWNVVERAHEILMNSRGNEYCK